MKLIISILFFIVNIVIFFQVRSRFIEIEEVQFINGQSHEYSLVVFIENDDTEVFDYELSNRILDYIEEIVTVNNIVVSKIDFRRDEFINFVASSSSIDEVFKLVTDESLIFTRDSESFYSSNITNEHAVSFFQLSPNQQISFQPLLQLERLSGGVYSFSARNITYLENATNSFLTEFDEIISRSFILENNINDIDNTLLLGEILPIIILTVFTIIVLLLFYIDNKAKIIVIKKTFGNSIFHIGKRIICPMLGLILVITASTKVLLFMLIIREINTRTIPIIQLLFFNGIILLAITTLIFILGCGLLLYIPVYSFIKNKKQTKKILVVLYFIKIILILILLPILSDTFKSINFNSSMLRQINHYQKNGDFLDYQFSHGLYLQYHRDGYIDLMRSLASRQVDSTVLHDYPLLYEYYQAYSILNKAGAIFISSGNFISGEPILNVNENFLEKYEIFDLYGNRVLPSDIIYDVIYLIPQFYKDEPKINELITYGNQILLVETTENIFDYTLRWSSFGLVEIPYIIRIRSNDYFYLHANPFHSVFFDGDFNEILQGTRFYNRIEISTVGYELEILRSGHNRIFREKVASILVYLVLALVVSVQYSYFYKKYNFQSLEIKRIMGYKPFRVYESLIVELMVNNTLLVVISHYLGVDFILLTPFIVLDIFIIFIFLIIDGFGSLSKYQLSKRGND